MPPPSWPWALPLYAKSPLDHALSLAQSSMFPRFGSFFVGFFSLRKPINFFCLSDSYLSFKTQVLVDERNLMPAMTKEAPRLAA